MEEDLIKSLLMERRIQILVRSFIVCRSGPINCFWCGDSIEYTISEGSWWCFSCFRYTSNQEVGLRSPTHRCEWYYLGIDSLDEPVSFHCIICDKGPFIYTRKEWDDLPGLRKKIRYIHSREWMDLVNGKSLKIQEIRDQKPKSGNGQTLEEVSEALLVDEETKISFAKFQAILLRKSQRRTVRGEERRLSREFRE